MPQIRKTEIHARRARKKKMQKLKAKYAEATTASAKESVLTKVSRVAPWISPEDFKKNAKA